MSEKIEEAIAMTIPPGYCSPGGLTSCQHSQERERCSDCPTIDNPTQGPAAVSTRPRKPHNFARFDSLLNFLQEWRGEDHADAITMHRSQIIEIIEGVKALRQPNGEQA